MSKIRELFLWSMVWDDFNFLDIERTRESKIHQRTEVDRSLHPTSNDHSEEPTLLLKNTEQPKYEICLWP